MIEHERLALFVLQRALQRAGYNGRQVPFNGHIFFKLAVDARQAYLDNQLLWSPVSTDAEIIAWLKEYQHKRNPRPNRYDPRRDPLLKAIHNSDLDE
jgi:hypothetical protein